MKKGNIRKVGEYWDAPNQWNDSQPVLRYWQVEGGDYPGYDASNNRICGYSPPELREMAREAGTLNAYLTA